MRGRARLVVEGIGAFHAVDKLKKAGILVFSVVKLPKNAISFEVKCKDLEKVFAILQHSCYNVKEKTLPRFRRRLFRASGLVAGACAFLLIVPLLQTRVLAIKVEGSGAFYEAQVMQILSEGGVEKYRAMPRDTAMMNARVLSLPNVSYCSLSFSGGVLTVEVVTSGEYAALPSKPLLASVSGRVEELVVIRGTALVETGAEVRSGDVLVSNVVATGGGEREIVVIARARISYPVRAEYEGSGEEVRSQAYLDYGRMTNVSLEKTDKGYLVTGTAYRDEILNMK